MIRTLIVEDDYRVAELHRTYTERLAGFQVVGVTGTATEAIKMIDSLTPDLLLMDVYLPDGSGLDLLRVLREDSHHQVDVIAITAARDIEDLKRAMRGGVLHYLIKPFRLAAFDEKLTNYAAMRERLMRVDEADQVEVDQIFGSLRSSRLKVLTKGLSEATLDVVIQVLQRSPSGLTAGALAEASGISRPTARRYLNRLALEGKAELKLRYGIRGRPEHRYRLAASD